VRRDEQLFKKILVPLDGSKSAIAALNMACEVAQRFQSHITLLHVASLGTVLPMKRFEKTQHLSPTEIQKMIMSSREAGFNILDQGLQILEGTDVPVKTILKEGYPATEIVRIARDRKLDLIIVGARGVSQIKELRIGRTTEQIVRNAPCSVVVCKHPLKRTVNRLLRTGQER
jgi:nucleotide-binding universal stress UspA family protein